MIHLSGGHLLFMALHDESESVAGDGADAEGGHEDGEVLASFHKLAQWLRPSTKGPVALKNRPQSERGSKDAEKEI